MSNSAILRSWTVEDVSRWLSSLHMNHLVPKFEVANVNGEVLCMMDEGYMPPLLKLNPAEKTTVMASIKSLKDITTYRNTISRQSVDSPRARTSTEHEGKKRRSQPSIPLATRHNTLPSNSRLDVYDPPEHKELPAAEILDDKCRHSGWIRKRGGGYKNWKRRYLVLRLGFAYYYENEYATKPKGHFCLYNCSVMPCTVEDKIKGFKWVFKVAPEDRKLRTFYVATAAKHEMEKWIEVLREEIERFKMSASEGDEGDYEHIYDPVCEDDDDDDHGEALYEGVEDTIDDDDDPYTRVRDEFPSPPSFPPSLEPQHLSPTHLSTNWQIADPSKSRKGIRDAPIIPPRSLKSLDRKTEPVPPSPALVRMIEEENPYLKIVSENEPGINPAPSQMSPSVPRHIPPSPELSRSHHSIPSPPETSPYHEDGHPPHLSNEMNVEEEDPYYIRLQTLDEVLPPYCMFDNITRESAESRLARTGRIGTYLLRDGTHKGAKYVLSVLTSSTTSKHYKLYYKDESLSYCLTEGKLFPSLSQLIEYYKQEELPKTPSIRLGEPYHPMDH